MTVIGTVLKWTHHCGSFYLLERKIQLNSEKKVPVSWENYSQCSQMKTTHFQRKCGEESVTRETLVPASLIKVQSPRMVLLQREKEAAGQAHWEVEKRNEEVGQQGEQLCGRGEGPGRVRTNSPPRAGGT